MSSAAPPSVPTSPASNTPAPPPNPAKVPPSTSAGKRVLAAAVFASLIGASILFDQGAFEGGGPASFEDYALSEVAADRGLVFTHEAADIHELAQGIQPHIMAVGAAVAAADVNGDGHQDLFVTNSEFGAACALFLGDADGNFREVAAQAGLADLNREGSGVCMGACFGDTDNDGDADLFVYRYGERGFFENTGSEGGVPRFVDRSAESGLGGWMNSNAATWIDADRDGLLDLYVAGYYRAETDLWNLTTSMIMHDSGEHAENGGLNRLFLNRGGNRFEDVTEAWGLDSTLWTFAVIAMDLDRDGWQDLYVANDYGSEEALLNQQGTGFKPAEDIGLGGDSKSGMSVDAGNVKNDGAPMMFITNISSSGWIFHGNNLRELDLAGSGRMIMQEGGSDCVNCGWAWSGVFGDLDNDGWQDLTVSNGFISQDKGRDYWYDSAQLGQGKGEILADAQNWPEIGTKSQSGFERTRLLLNNRGRRYKDVGESAGITDIHDGRGLVLHDFDSDGDLDLVIANQKAPLVYYEASTNPEHTWIAFDLEGTGATNRDAYGAEVWIEWDHSEGRSMEQFDVVCSSNGFSSGPAKRLHFGLGPDVTQVRARVRWPDGSEQDLGALDAGTVHSIVQG
ncbi:MAG: CRTAC1 family protein [Planctomycetota bacterium]|jgi:hypothetical protein